ncbi:uncharacterized protein LOC144865978 [Branchiostoma floridae x Branchiostoma japonicum]
MAESVNPEDAVANGWILEFVCYTTWKEFVAGDDAFYQGRDFLQGLLVRSVESSPERQRRVKLIQLLCRLADGRDHSIRYEEDGDVTALESALPIFDTLVENADLPADQVEHARGLIKVQSVLVCCQDGNFDAAEEVFQRVWQTGGAQSAKDKKLLTKVTAVLRSRDPQHPTIQNSCSYDKFLGWMADFLQLIVDDFKSPFLLKAAQRIVQDRIEAADPVESEDAEKSETDSEAYETPSENEARPKEENYVLPSRRLLRECFVVMAKEERSSAEFRKDVVGYHYDSLVRDLKLEKQQAKASGATVRRSPNGKQKQIEKSEPKKMQTTSEDTVVQGSNPPTPEPTDRHRHGQAEKRRHGEREVNPCRDTRANDQPSTSGVSKKANHRKSRRVVQDDSESEEDTAKENSKQKSMFRKRSREKRIQEDDSDSENEAAKENVMQKSRFKKRSPEKPAYRIREDDSDSDDEATKENTDQRRSFKKRTRERENDLESEDDAAKENATRKASFKKRSREKSAYGNGVKETWSSDEETFRSPVRKKYVYESDSEDSADLPSALPCPAGGLRVPVIPAKFRVKNKLDITSKGYIRIRHQWTEEEVSNLIDGVRRYGQGNWSKILDNFPFNGRTNVNLKDKWRQLVKSRVVKDYP